MNSLETSSKYHSLTFLWFCFLTIYLHQWGCWWSCWKVNRKWTKQIAVFVWKNKNVATQTQDVIWLRCRYVVTYRLRNACCEECCWKKLLEKHWSRAAVSNWQKQKNVVLLFVKFIKMTRLNMFYKRVDQIMFKFLSTNFLLWGCSHRHDVSVLLLNWTDVQCSFLRKGYWQVINTTVTKCSWSSVKRFRFKRAHSLL